MTRKQEFIDFVKNGQVLLPIDQWKKNTNLYKIWQQRVDENDIRYKLCHGKVEVFVETIYNFLRDHLDEFLGIVYESSFTSKEFRDINKVNLIDDNTVCNTPNNPGYFRNVCFEEIVICGGDADIKLSIKNAIVNTLNGKIRKTFFMPALFNDIYNGKVSSNIVLTFNKSCKLMSVFSPNVYRYLLRCLRKHSANSKSILFATASWGVPVVASDELDYDIVDIVDVQDTVLHKCHTIHSELFANRNLLFEQPYTLETYCTPSEVMDTLINKKYDHIISCPPYYDLEIYGASDKQSTDLYKTYGDWLENYWRKTVIASKNLLNDAGVFSFIMGHHVRYQYMSNDMAKIAIEEGFCLVNEIKIIPKRKTENIYLSPIEKYEVCSIFRR
jgi:hypothetical protein